MFLDPTDSVIATMTAEGRNLQARAKLGDCSYRIIGWAAGRGGYEDDASSSSGATQTLTINSQPAVGDTLTVGSSSIAASNAGNGTTLFQIGADEEETLINLRDTILANPSLKDFFGARLLSGTSLEIESLVRGGIANFIPIASSGSWATLGGATFAGGAGLAGANPVKVKPFVDNASAAEAIIELTSNASINGDGFFLNGAPFLLNLQWAEQAGGIPETVQNVVDAINDSPNPKVKRIVQALVNPANPNQLIIRMLIEGTRSNSFPIVMIENVPSNFILVQNMIGGSSTDLEDPAYPVPPNLGAFTLPDGRIERPSSTSVSWVCRIPDGATGLNGYGELGLYAEVLSSNYLPEVGQFPGALISADGGPVVITVRSHGLELDAPISFTTDGTLPTGLNTTDTYYARPVDVDTFQVATTQGGTTPLVQTTLNTGGGRHTVLSSERRRVLYAQAHFPLQSKTDRSLFTFRIVLSF